MYIHYNYYTITPPGKTNISKKKTEKMMGILLEVGFEDDFLFPNSQSRRVPFFFRVDIRFHHFSGWCQ